MATGPNTKFLNALPSNSKETILLQIKDDEPKVFAPKLLKWDEVTIPEVIEKEDT